MDIRKRSYVFPMVSIIFHPDKQLALIKLANLATREVLKPIKLIKKTPKAGKTVLMYRSNYPTILCQYTKISSTSGHNNSNTLPHNDAKVCDTKVEQFISIETKAIEGQQKKEPQLKSTPLLYKNRLMGLMHSNQLSPSGQTLVLNILYYSEWIKNNTDYKCQ